MAINGQAFGSERKFLEIVSNIFAAWASNLHTALKEVQTAQMKSALLSMNDDQLKQIGLTRRDIPQYAETLMTAT